MRWISCSGRWRPRRASEPVTGRSTISSRRRPGRRATASRRVASAEGGEGGRGMPVPFLTARWSHLLLVNLEAPEAVLRPIIPTPLELDHWRGKAYVSVVGVCMDTVRVGRGWRVPGFTAHAQVNFRTYVRFRDRAGVWFIRQLVTSRLMAAVARWAYGEPFEAAPIDARVTDAPDTVTVEYRIARRGRMAATAGAARGVPRPGSAEAFFQERFEGYRLNR